MGAPLRPLMVVVARAENGIIGKDGQLPWHYPEDLKHFRVVTEGHAIVMGRRTFDEVGKPLPKRRNLVVSRTLASREGVEVFGSLTAALDAAYATDEEPRIIGGRALYEEAWPLATTIWLTRIHRDVDGDVSLELDLRGFRGVEARKSGDLTFERLTRVSES
jgi:dihydrofolate reductase